MQDMNYYTNYFTNDHKKYIFINIVSIIVKIIVYDFKICIYINKILKC